MESILSRSCRKKWNLQAVIRCGCRILSPVLSLKVGSLIRQHGDASRVRIGNLSKGEGKVLRGSRLSSGTSVFESCQEYLAMCTSRSASRSAGQDWAFKPYSVDLQLLDQAEFVYVPLRPERSLYVFLAEAFHGSKLLGDCRDYQKGFLDL